LNLCELEPKLRRVCLTCAILHMLKQQKIVTSY
jgi:hypothetical protein